MADYYQQFYREYNAATYYVDPTSFLKPLTKELKAGASILDVGCGSGRDLVWLQKRKYRVTGFERSAGLAEMARRNAGCNVIRGDFEAYDFSLHRFDALLLCGSLVHITPDRLVPVMGNILKGLKRKGIVLISLKEGQGARTQSDGRIYYLWSDKGLREKFEHIGFIVHTFNRGVSKVNDRDTWLSYLLKEA